jgi:uncharacterized SAM-binding protein YcdF (DUF218 family)
MSELVVPPAALLVAAGAGWLLRRKRPRLGATLIAGSVAAFVLLSMPFVAALLLGSLQDEAAPAAPDPRCGAIVVLAADASLVAPEHGGPTCGPMTLERVRYAARLARETGTPVLVSGGPPRAGVRSHAEMMKDVLERELGVAVRWTEGRSGDTRDNARMSAEILAREGIGRAYLVTHAWHVPRARAELRHARIEVVAAPTGFRAPPTFELGAFVPTAKALRESSWAFHEWIGRAWYALTR